MAVQLVVMNTVLPAVAPLGSAVELTVPLEPPDVNPRLLLTLKPTLASLVLTPLLFRPSPCGAAPADVPNGVGVPGTKIPVATGGPVSFTSSSGNTGWDGNGAPVMKLGDTLTVESVPLPDIAGGITMKRFTVKPAVAPTT